MDYLKFRSYFGDIEQWDVDIDIIYDRYRTASSTQYRDFIEAALTMLSNTDNLRTKAKIIYNIYNHNPG